MSWRRWCASPNISYDVRTGAGGPCESAVALARVAGCHPVRQGERTWPVADCFGAPIITLGEAGGCNYASYPNAMRWPSKLKGLKSWAEVNETGYGLVNPLQDNVFQAL